MTIVTKVEEGGGHKVIRLSFYVCGETGAKGLSGTGTFFRLP